MFSAAFPSVFDAASSDGTSDSESEQHTAIAPLSKRPLSDRLDTAATAMLGEMAEQLEVIEPPAKRARVPPLEAMKGAEAQRVEGMITFIFHSYADTEHGPACEVKMSPAVFADARFDPVDFIADVHTVCDRALVRVLCNQVLIEKAERML